MFAFHQQAGQVKHRETFAAAGSAEIGSAFTVTVRFLLMLDIFKQSPSSVILRIATNNFRFFISRVGKKDKVAKDIPKTVFIKHSFN